MKKLMIVNMICLALTGVVQAKSGIIENVNLYSDLFDNSRITHSLKQLDLYINGYFKDLKKKKSEEAIKERKAMGNFIKTYSKQRVYGAIVDGLMATYKKSDIKAINKIFKQRKKIRDRAKWMTSKKDIQDVLKWKKAVLENKVSLDLKLLKKLEKIFLRDMMNRPLYFYLISINDVMRHFELQSLKNKKGKLSSQDIKELYKKKAEGITKYFMVKRLKGQLLDHYYIFSKLNSKDQKALIDIEKNKLVQQFYQSADKFLEREIKKIAAEAKKNSKMVVKN